MRSAELLRSIAVEPRCSWEAERLARGGDPLPVACAAWHDLEVLAYLRRMWQQLPIGTVGVTSVSLCARPATYSASICLRPVVLVIFASDGLATVGLMHGLFDHNE